MLSLFVTLTCAASAQANGPEWFEPEAPKAKPAEEAAQPAAKPRPAEAARRAPGDNTPSPSSKAAPADGARPAAGAPADGARPSPGAADATRAPAKAAPGHGDGSPAAPKAAPGDGSTASPDGAPGDDTIASPKAAPGDGSPASPKGSANPAATAADGRPASPRLAPRAASRPAPKAAREATTTEWYGGQTLVADGASVALVLGGAATQTPALAALGVLSYVVMPPTIHALKGEHGRAGVSLGFRLLGPVIGVLGGMVASDVFCGSCGVDYSATWVVGGALVGLASGPVVDAAFLSKRTVKASPSASFAPSIVPSRQGMTVGLAGAF